MTTDARKVQYEIELVSRGMEQLTAFSDALKQQIAQLGDLARSAVKSNQDTAALTETMKDRATPAVGGMSSALGKMVPWVTAATLGMAAFSAAVVGFERAGRRFEGLITESAAAMNLFTTLSVDEVEWLKQLQLESEALNVKISFLAEGYITAGSAVKDFTLSQSLLEAAVELSRTSLGMGLTEALGRVMNAFQNGVVTVEDGVQKFAFGMQGVNALVTAAEEAATDTTKFMVTVDQEFDRHVENITRTISRAALGVATGFKALVLAAFNPSEMQDIYEEAFGERLDFRSALANMRDRFTRSVSLVNWGEVWSTIGTSIALVFTVNQTMLAAFGNFWVQLFAGTRQALQGVDWAGVEESVALEVERVFSGAFDFADEVGEWFSGLGDSIIEFLEGIDWVSVGETAAGLVTTVFGPKKLAIATTIGESFVGMRERLVEYVEGIDWEAVRVKWAELFSAALDASREAGTVVHDVVDTTMELLGSVDWGEVSATFGTAMETIVVESDSALESLQTFVGDMVTKINETIEETDWGEVWLTFATALFSVTDWLGDKVVDFGEWLGEFTNSLFTAIDDFDWTEFWTKLGSGVAAVVVVGATLMAALSTLVIDILKGIGEFFTTVDWGEVAETIGEALGGLLAAGVEGIVTLTGYLAQLVVKIRDFFVEADWSEVASTALDVIIGALAAIPYLVVVVAKFIGGFVSELIQGLGKVDWLEFGQNLLSLLFNLVILLPLIVAAVGKFIVALVIEIGVALVNVDWLELGKKFIGFFGGVLSVTSDLIDKIREFVDGVVDNVIEFVREQFSGVGGRAWDAIQNWLSKPFTANSPVGDATRAFVTGVADNIISGWEVETREGGRTYEKFQASTARMIEKTIGAVNSAGSQLASSIGGLPDVSAPPSFPEWLVADLAERGIKPPAMAEGGVVTAPTLALIGERGPEAVVPLDRYQGRGETTIVVELDGQTIMESVLPELDRYVRLRGAT